MAPEYSRTCRNCGVAFVTTYPRKTCCGHLCNSAIQNKKRPTTKYVERACVVCGTKFIPNQVRGPGRRWCSMPCREEIGKRRLERYLKDSTFAWNGGKRDSRLRADYGITSAQYDEMLKAQDGKCAICGGANDVRIKSGYRVPLDVDHCHRKGSVRKLLCRKCNIGLGAFRDNPKLMRLAIAYLKEHE